MIPGRATLVDTGPLVTFLAAGLDHGEWVREQWKQLRPPLLTCEAVITEAAFLLKREGCETDALFELMDRGIVTVAMQVNDELPDLRVLMRRYKNLPMSLADACLVRLSEVYENSQVFTLDSDFQIYRRSGTKSIPLLFPPTAPSILSDAKKTPPARSRKR